LRARTEQFEKGFQIVNGFDEDSLKWCIDGLLGSDLLTDPEPAVRSDFSGNKVVLRELADVLNMGVSDLGNWSWGKKASLLK
jgi:hypothetical protein